MKLTRYGRSEWLGALLTVCGAIIAAAMLSFVFMLLSPGLFLALSIFLVLAWIAFASFFRDPERTIPEDRDTILAPADGIVSDIELIKSESMESERIRSLFQGRDLLRVGIISSFAGVPINRAPAEMKVLFLENKTENGLSARGAGHGSKENETALFGTEAAFENVAFPLALRLISFVSAHRIVCPVKPGDHFERGQRFGMIRFASRTELYLPAGMGFDLTVKVGDSVAAGVSILTHIYPATKEKLSQTQIRDAQGTGDVKK